MLKTVSFGSSFSQVSVEVVLKMLLSGLGAGLVFSWCELGAALVFAWCELIAALVQAWYLLKESR